MRLKPLGAAKCTECGSKKTRRLGYSKDHKGSLWICEHNHAFVVPMIVMKPATD